MCMRMRNVVTAVDPKITSVFFPFAEAYNAVKAQYKFPASIRNSLYMKPDNCNSTTDITWERGNLLE